MPVPRPLLRAPHDVDYCVLRTTIGYCVLRMTVRLRRWTSCSPMAAITCPMCPRLTDRHSGGLPTPVGTYLGQEPGEGAPQASPKPLSSRPK
jgi:hypothetical protein